MYTLGHKDFVNSLITNLINKNAPIVQLIDSKISDTQIRAQNKCLEIG